LLILSLLACDDIFANHNYKDLSLAQMRDQWQSARHVAGSKFILTPGCSVPNDSTDEELSRLPQVIGA
jgi:hypothetical protein